MTRPARAVVTDLFAQLAAGAAADHLAEFFAEDVDWHIAGDLTTVPWIGRRHGRAGVAEFYRQLRELTVPHEFQVRDILGDGERCVVLGELRTEVKASGGVIESEFAFDITVRDGLIVRYHMFEDSWAVARAVRGD